MSVTESRADLEQTLRDQFGLERFRPGQREVIAAVLAGRDVLCVMPTGGGKSLCYQLPAVRQEGLTLVVSPLIALMKDQVDGLRARGLRATLINSTLDPEEQRARLMEAEAGRYDLLYVAPERFRSGRFVEAMARLRPALLAVDEAHCISEWGHDFRPDYARLGLARRKLGMPPCIALTATATDLVRRDIAEQLDLRDPAQFVTGFDRPNLSYRVVEARRDAEKLAELARLLEQTRGSIVVYASSRRRCESVAEVVGRELRRSVVVYHAGMEREQRHAAQEAFMGGDADVIVATNAFGMGVDKPDIRAVVHFNLPGTLEAYYQEAGRAGRDGEPARCVLLYAPGDRKLQQLFIDNEYPPRDVVFRIYDSLRSLDAEPIELTQAEIKEATAIELGEGAVGAALKILEGAGALERFSPRENMAIVRIDREPDDPPLADRVSTQAHVQKLVMMGLEGLVDRRLGEPVYFHPEEFATALGLDRTALNRALRHLSAELPMTYVPPFRGNAIRIVDRSRRSRSLEIDFAALETRKQQEYDKLDRMIRYAESRSCRRSVILSYFGEPHPADCGRCDRCGDEAVESSPPCPIDTPAAREVVLKALSGVARTRGRFGKTVVSQMLTGSGSEKMGRFGLSKLSTFGILGDFTQPEVVCLIDSLTQAGLIEAEEVDRFKPVVGLSDSGWEYLRGRGEGIEPPELSGLPDHLALKLRRGGLGRAPTASKPPHPSRGEGDDLDGPRAAAGRISGESTEARDQGEADEDLQGDPLWERLRSLRLEWARAEGVPAFCIFHDSILKALVRQRPRTPQALAGVKGIGPAKLERFGSALLEAIAGAPPAGSQEGRSIPIDRETDSLPVRDEPSAVATTSDPDSLPAEVAAVTHEEWSCRLLDRGFTVAEAAAIRGLEPSAILRHAARMARTGRIVPLEAFLDSEAIARWDALLAERGPDALPPDPEAPADLLDLFLACRGASCSPSTSEPDGA